MNRRCTQVCCLVFIILTVECTILPLTYDLVRYSNVNLLETLSSTTANKESCKKIGYDFKCSLSSERYEDFRKSIWQRSAAWEAFFNQYVKEVDIIVDFNRVSRCYRVSILDNYDLKK